MSSQLIYQSPLRIFDSLGLDSENIDSEALRLERKRLLLEIQISPSQTTELHGKQVGKNDVIEVFDRLEGLTNLAFHRIIFNNSDLLNLLETQKIPKLSYNVDFIKFDRQEEERSFQAFISPYLAEAYSKASTSILRNSDYSSLLRTSSFFRFMTQADAYLAFAKIENYCKSLEKNLEQLAASNVKFNRNDFSFLQQDPFYDLINKLSPYFSRLPDIVAIAVLNFCFHSQRKAGRGSHLVTLSDQARRLHCSEEIQSALIKNRDIYWRNREGMFIFKRIRVWSLAIFVFLLIVLVLRITSKCEASRKVDPEVVELQSTLRNAEDSNEKTEKSVLSEHELFLHDLQQATLSRVHLGTYNSAESSMVEIPQLIPNSESSGIIKEANAQQTLQIHNNTSYEMVMILLDDHHLISRYIPSKEKVEFPHGTNASLFFYSGANWNSKDIIAYNGARLNGQPLFLNGRFMHVPLKSIAFLKRLYTLRDEPTSELVIKEEHGQFELYQNSALVNYRY